MTNTHTILVDLVRRTKCKPGWHFSIVNRDGARRLVITVAGFDSSRPSEKVPKVVQHPFPVPEAEYNAKSWQRWIFEQCRRLENHELGEWFRVDADRPYLPLHAPGEDPYTVHEFRDPVDALTTQDGSIRKPYTDH